MHLGMGEGGVLGGGAGEGGSGQAVRPRCHQTRHSAVRPRQLCVLSRDPWRQGKADGTGAVAIQAVTEGELTRTQGSRGRSPTGQGVLQDFGSSL